MRFTIIKDDNAVTVDGGRHSVDCSSLPADFHALQWDGDAGELEYRLVTCSCCGGRSKKSNAVVFDVAPYQRYLDEWAVSKAKAQEAQADATGPEG